MLLELKRRADWPERLIACADRHRKAPFAWGAYDCATFFDDAVDAVAGFHILAAHMPWDSERAAAKRLLAAGYRDMLQFCETLLPSIEPSRARRGDVGFADVRHALTCPAVILGAEAVTRTETGWLIFSASALKHTFKIG